MDQDHAGNFSRTIFWTGESAGKSPFAGADGDVRFREAAFPGVRRLMGGGKEEKPCDFFVRVVDDFDVEECFFKLSRDVNDLVITEGLDSRTDLFLEGPHLFQNGIPGFL